MMAWKGGSPGTGDNECAKLSFNREVGVGSGAVFATSYDNLF